MATPEASVPVAPVLTPEAFAALVALVALVTLVALVARVAAFDAAQAAWTLERRQLLLKTRELEQRLAAHSGGAPVGSSEALSLFGELPLPVASVALPTAPRAPRGGAPPAPRPHRPLDPALPREIVRLPDPPDAATRGLTPGFTEVLEVLARRPSAFFVQRYECQVWVSPLKTAPLASPWPPGIWPRAHVHVSVVAHVAVAHFAQRQPYYRQEQELARLGVHLPRSTQGDLMAEVERQLAPLAAELRRRVLASGYVHLDATPLACCDRTRPGATQTVHVWTYRARSPDPAVSGLLWYDFQQTKTPKEPAKVLKRYRGIVQTDGASGLDSLGPPERITHLACWAHARRYFVEAVASGDARAAPERRATLADRLATWRPRFSRPLAERLFVDAATVQVHLPPKSVLAVALGYLLGQRASLLRCVTTPGAVLDNNAAENAIRPLKLGFRNWLFVGHPDAGPRLANLYTVIENARQANLDLDAYLTDVLTRFTGSAPQAWLPHAWQRARTDGITA